MTVLPPHELGGWTSFDLAQLGEVGLHAFLSTCEKCDRIYDVAEEPAIDTQGWVALDEG